MKATKYHERQRMKRPLEEGWQQTVDAFAGRIPIRDGPPILTRNSHTNRPLSSGLPTMMIVGSIGPNDRTMP